jgi:hypothetical protein
MISCDRKIINKKRQEQNSCTWRLPEHWPMRLGQTSGCRYLLEQAS